MPPATMDRRVVEVIADLGPTATRPLRHGSGLLLGARTVLTAAHVVREALTVVIRGPDKRELRADMSTALIGEAARCDLALLSVPEAEEYPHLPIALVTHQVAGGDLVEGCWSVGYPAFQEVQRPGAALPMRETAEVRGRILPLAGLVEELFALQVSHCPRPLPDTSVQLGLSEWAGMSGAPVFAGDHLVGVITEHSPRRGSADLTVTPLSRLHNPATAPSGTRAWLDRLGVSDPAGLPVLPRAVPSACLRPRRNPPPRLLPSMLLRSDFRVVPFGGREEELKQLRAWCALDDTMSVRLTTAPGGQGKTRLADQLCDELGAEWTAGFLDPAASQEDLSRLARGGSPCLLVVDYAEARSDQINELIGVFTGEHAARLRLLLLARSGGDWWTRLREQADEETAAVLHVAEYARLEPLPRDQSSRPKSFEAARDEFARRLGVDPRHAPVPPDLDHPRYGLTLALHMAALAAVLDAVNPLSARPTDSDPATRVLAHERRYWQRTGIGIDPAILDRVVAAATLCGAVGREDAYQLLSRVRDLEDQQHLVLSKCLSWAAAIHPGEAALVPLQPELLGEEHVADVLRAVPEVAGNLAESADDSQLHRLLTVLGRAAPRHEHIAAMLPSLLACAPERRVPLAVEVAGQLPDPAPLVAAVEPNLAGVTSTHAIIRIVDCLPLRTVAMATLAVAANQALVSALGTTGSRPEFAWILQNLAVRYAKAGDHAQSLSWGKRAIAAIREGTSLEQRTTLAYCRDTVAGALLSLGQPDEAARSFRRNVDFWEQQYKIDPGGSREPLMGALANLGTTLIELRNAKATVRVCDRLAALCRQPCGGDPADQAHRAEALTSLSRMQAALGQSRESVASLREAEAALRPLAAWRPDAYGPSLATSLGGLAAALGLYRQSADAVAPAEEAVRTWQDLATRHPKRYLAHLVSARQTLAGILGQLERYPEALEEIGTALRDMVRLLGNDDATYFDLAARAANNVCSLGTAGDFAGQALSHLDGVERWCRHDKGAECSPLLGRVLTARSHLLMEDGQITEAVACADEAVSLLRQASEASLALAQAYAVSAASKAKNGDIDNACVAASHAIRGVGEADPADDITVLNVAKLLIALTKSLVPADHIDAAELVARHSVDMLRGPVDRNPALREDLADALYHRGLCLKGLGSIMWRGSVDEAIQLLRRQVADGFGTRRTQDDINHYLRFRTRMLSTSVVAVPRMLPPDKATSRDARPGTGKHPGRNDPCPCGSGKKYKHCCGSPKLAPSDPPDSD